MNIRYFTTPILLVFIFSGSALAYEPVSDNLPLLIVKFVDDSWDGIKIPDGEQCRRFRGSGNTPKLSIEDIPEGVNAIIVEFNDASYGPLSSDGGHGKVGFWVSSSFVLLPSAPGETLNMPEGIFIEAENRSGGFGGPGYLPPCSGGRGNLYFAEIKAVYKSISDPSENKIFAIGRIELGRY